MHILFSLHYTPLNIQIPPFQYKIHTLIHLCATRNPTQNPLMELFNKNQKEDEEESLSLVDLPINLSPNKPKPEKTKPAIDDINFNFSLYNCSVFDESEMCSADDVFFQGQILPYRHSISSDTGISVHRTPTRHMLRSESMDYKSACGMISSSRSSSINSQSSSSGSGSLTGSINYFHSHPSPSPSIRTSNRYISQSNLSRRSNLWDVFRVGLVKTPEIELLDIKNRSINGNSRNNSRNSTSSQNSGNNNKTRDERIKINEKKKNKNRFFDFGGCKCSVNVINPVSCEAIEKGQRKTTSSRCRTFEWIKDLSIECGSGSLE